MPKRDLYIPFHMGGKGIRGGSVGRDGTLNKGLTEGEVGEEENGCASEGTEAPKESAPASQWVKVKD